MPTLLLPAGNPDSLRQSPLFLLVELFQLTAAEGKLALEMMEGLSIQAIAAKASISQTTARNHVKTIFAKTGGSRRTAWLYDRYHAAQPTCGVTEAGAVPTGRSQGET